MVSALTAHLQALCEGLSIWMWLPVTLSMGVLSWIVTDIGESRPTGVTLVHLGCATPEQEVLVVEESWLSWSQRAQAKSSVPLFLLRHSLTALDFCCVPLLWLPWMTEFNQWTEISPLLPWVVWCVVHHISWNQTKAVKKEGQSSTPL